MDATNLADLYDLPLLEWADIEGRLGHGVAQAPGTGGPDRHTCWLATVDEDGSPHVTGVGALWVDGTFWFETGAGTRKGRNLARDRRCTLSVATHDFDLVVEGEARPVTDPATVAAMAERWRSRGLARPGGRQRVGPDRGVQRALGRAAALDGVPDDPPDGHGGGHGGAGRGHPLEVPPVAQTDSTRSGSVRRGVPIGPGPGGDHAHG